MLFRACAGVPVPDGVREKLDGVRETVRTGGALASRYEREVLNLAEAVLLRDRVGEHFAASVTEVDEKNPARGDITIADPAIEARVQGDRALPLGDAVTVVLTEADPAQRSITFTLAPE